MDIICVENESCVPFDRCPERHMLLEMLYRAVRDLSPMQVPCVTRAAIQWFNDTGKNRTGFSFQQVAEELHLSAGQIDYLQKQVGEATKRLYED